MLETRRRMASNTYQQIALMLLILCIVSPIESRTRENKKREKINGPDSLTTQQQQQQQKIQQETQSQQHILQNNLKSSTNLCSKEREMKLLCHCTPEDVIIKQGEKERILMTISFVTLYTTLCFFRFYIA